MAIGDENKAQSNTKLENPGPTKGSRIKDALTTTAVGAGTYIVGKTVWKLGAAGLKVVRGSKNETAKAAFGGVSSVIKLARPK